MRKNALAALLLAALGLLSACATSPRERAAGDLSAMPIAEPAPAPAEDGRGERPYAATLYFLNETGERLVPVTRQIDAGADPAEAALWALLAGPQEGEAGARWPELGDARADGWAEFSGETATVSLPARARALSPQQLYAVRLAVAATLTEFASVRYVNVLVDGREEGVDLGATKSAGTFSRAAELDALASYERLSAQGDRGGTMLTTLFLPSADGRYVLAMVRSVAFETSSAVDGLYTLLSELGRSGGDDLLAQSVPAPMDYIAQMPEIVWAGDGAYRAIQLQFSEGLNGALEQAGLTRGVYLAMLADTLLGFVPGVDGLLVSVGEEAVESLPPEQTPDGEALSFGQGMARRADFLGYTGSPVTLYAPEGERGAVRAVRAVLPQGRRNDPRALLDAVLALCRDAGLLGDLTDADILAVRMQDGEALVNLSDAFAGTLSALTPSQERAAVYAMVNTLTQGGEARSAAFYFEGGQRERLAGALEMRGSFLRNPGLAVN